MNISKIAAENEFMLVVRDEQGVRNKQFPIQFRGKGILVITVGTPDNPGTDKMIDDTLRALRESMDNAEENGKSPILVVNQDYKFEFIKMA